MPVIGTPRAITTTTALILAVCAAVLLAVGLIGPPPEADAVGLRVLAALAIIPATGLLVGGRRQPALAHHLVLAFTTALVTGGVVLGGGDVTSIAISGLYVLVVLDAFLFLPWWSATAHLTVAAVAGGAGLAVSGPTGPVAPLAVAGIGATIGLVVGWYVRSAANAELDAVTGLPNRLGLDRQLSDCLREVERTGNPLALALIDLDAFSRLNEQMGRAAGDRLLRDAAQSWRQTLPAPVVLARIGGDEFAAVFPDHPAAQAAEHVERLRKDLSHRCSFSAGVAAWEPGDTSSLLVNRADALLYRAKRGGRSRTTTEERRGPAVSQLRRAMDAGHLLPVFQPIVNLRTGRMTGVEALIRWQHPDRGWIPPTEFIPVAEESGLITDIGLWMLEQSCRHAATWVSAGLLHKVTVNVSGRELLEPGYADLVEDVLRRTRLAPGHLVLEITETTLDADAPDVAQVLRTLRSAGIQVAIDDFGTGFSTLSRLNRLPVDVLKIDQSFVTDMTPDTPEAPLMAAIIALGHALGLTLVAEGIEQEHQRDALTALGCDEGQGFLFGVPSPAEKIPVLARRVPAPRAPGTQVGTAAPG
jgi:diguanylate cyclase (GGDEF)-like protein